MNAWLKSFGVILSAFVLTLAQGGAEPIPAHSSSESAENASSEYPLDRVIQMLDTHLKQLQTNLEVLNGRIQKLQEFPETHDPIIHELRALDLVAWELHREQWRLQREYLEYTHQQLQRVQENPDEKPNILKEWTARKEEYEAALDDFRQKRQDLEAKRIQVEARLMQRYLQ